MIFRQIQWSIIFRILLLFIALSASAFFIVSVQYIFLLITIPLTTIITRSLVNFQLKVFKELNQFTEAVRYRDFSGNFNSNGLPLQFKELSENFNTINLVLRTISREKETQYHYLQKILEIVETGILFYAEDSGEVTWMNESLKKMLRIPYLKTIKSLESRNENLYKEIISMRPGVVTVRNDEGAFRALLSVSSFQTEGKRYKLIAFQNINEVLDEAEAEAWHKLLRVLTHEIMNSIAPISSLADTLKTRLEQLATNDASLQDIGLGIDTIKNRSAGLLKFAETYRSLNKIGTPELQHLYVRQIFENIYVLMLPTLNQKCIEVEIILNDPDLSIKADPVLIEQALINLIVNAMAALKDTTNPKITLSAYQVPYARVILKVTDNGPGISEELHDKIFIPFFSTKKLGSGIGLTICRQIMLLHHGNIQVQIKEGVETAFLLQFQ
jgi:two-component system nitrogen regulation sensor histidine kinase NtrY